MSSFLQFFGKRRKARSIPSCSVAFGNNQDANPQSLCLSEPTVVQNAESVTRWLRGVKDGDDRNIEQLWNRYFQRLIRLAGSKLPAPLPSHF